ncbi:MAG TPA: hypothetical protein GXZ82_03780 [Firmicutes bacterium]|nr:hypothetical protein [Bacillota bacterium]
MSTKVVHKTTRQCSTCIHWLSAKRQVRYGMPGVIEYDEAEHAACRECGTARSGWHGGSCKRWRAWIR